MSLQLPFPVLLIRRVDPDRIWYHFSSAQRISTNISSCVGVRAVNSQHFVVVVLMAERVSIQPVILKDISAEGHILGRRLFSPGTWRRLPLSPLTSLLMGARNDPYLCSSVCNLTSFSSGCSDDIPCITGFEQLKQFPLCYVGGS